MSEGGRRVGTRECGEKRRKKKFAEGAKMCSTSTRDQYSSRSTSLFVEYLGPVQFPQ